MCCDQWAPYNPANRAGDCGCDSRATSYARAGLGAVGAPAFDGGPGSDTSNGWIERAGSWAWSRISSLWSSVPDCIGNPLSDPEAAGPPCPGETPDAIALAAWNAAPLAARAELWARAVVNNPQWRCHNPGDLLGNNMTALLIRRAAWGGRDCRMSRDRGSLRPAWDAFVARYGGGVPAGPEGFPLLGGSGRGLALAAGAAALFILLTPDGP